MSAQSIRNSNENVTVLNIDVFKRQIAGMSLTELAAVYDALMASGNALGAISNQCRCGDTYNYNLAGSLLSDLESQAHECVSAVVDAMGPIRPESITEQVEKVRVVVGYNMLCGANAEEVLELAASLHDEQKTVVAEAA